MLKSTKVLLFCGCLVALLAVGLNIYHPEIVNIMETKEDVIQPEDFNIQGYGADGGIGKLFFFYVVYLLPGLADQSEVIGLDLGVEYSRVGIFRGKNFEIIPDSQGRVRTPSYVSFVGDRILVGEEAKALVGFNPKGIVHNIMYA